jgi:hypothetical protein
MTRAAVRRIPVDQLRPWEFQRADGAVVVQHWKLAAMKLAQARAIAAKSALAWSIVASELAARRAQGVALNDALLQFGWGS